MFVSRDLSLKFDGIYKLFLFRYRVTLSELHDVVRILKSIGYYLSFMHGCMIFVYMLHGNETYYNVNNLNNINVNFIRYTVTVDVVSGV